jgi:hypothetical protein
MFQRGIGYGIGVLAVSLAIFGVFSMIPDAIRYVKIKRM